MFALMASGRTSRRCSARWSSPLLAGGVSAVGAVATAEQFPGEGRVTGLALGATMATAIFGGLTPCVAQWLVERTGWPMAPGIMIALVGALRAAGVPDDARNRAAQRAPQPVSIVLIVRNRIRRSSQGEKYLM